MLGQTVANYRIIEKLGEGGMGVVFKAEDLNLRRIVALKFLSPQAIGNPEEKARLLREAQATAGLDHPAICPVYGIHEHDGSVFLTMAYIDGPNLAAKVKQRPLPFDQALDIAMQMAQALEEAHQHGVIHRDIKPSNVMLTAKGQVKILDFGLAQVAGSTRITKTGTMMGTPAYMSPEQAEGRAADRRTDIWSLGVVLYEMLTGLLPFEAEQERAVLYAILHKEPQPVTACRSGLPLEVDRIVAKALAKDPGERYQHADDLLVDLKALRGTVASAEKRTPVPVARTQPARREMLAWALALLAVLSALGLWLFRPQPPPTPQPAFRTSVLPPPGNYFAPYGYTISPDGLRLAFIGVSADGSDMLWVQSLNARGAQQIRGTEGAAYPFWAPDSRRIGFFAGGSLKIVDTASSTVQILGGAPVGRGGAWNEQGVIVFAPANASPLLSISERGGTPMPVTSVAPESGRAHRWPMFLPDGRRFLYFQEWGPTDPASPDGIYAGSLDGGNATLVSGEIFGSVAFASGYLLYLDDRSLMARPFDPDGLRFTGPAVPIVDQELDQDYAFGKTAFSFSREGNVIFQSVADTSSELVWFSRDGVERNIIPDPGARSPHFSPDGRLLVVASNEASNGRRFIRVHDLQRGVATQLTDGGYEEFPTWSPDGAKIAYAFYERGRKSLNEVRADGSGEPVVLAQGAHMVPTDYSPDGRYLVYQSMERGSPQLVVLDTAGGTSTVLDTPGGRGGTAAQFSPDGRWLAHLAQSELFVQPFPPTGARTQISSQGASQARWSRDGKKLYFMAMDRKLMEVTIDTSGGEFLPSAPRPLFQTRIVAPAFVVFQYDVAPDDSRFLINSLRPEAPLTLLTNWTSMLQK